MADLAAAPILAALSERPEGALVRELLEHDPNVAIVGGFVRDVLLGQRPLEIDLVVEGDGAAVAGQLARAGAAELRSYPQFGTHTLRAGSWQIDIAAARREQYPAPGALPQVQAATIEEDLQRRDFTVNAIAVKGDSVLAHPDAARDLATKSLRVLHPGSFADDPTRLIRLARYAVRLGLKAETQTAELAQSATLATLSPARLVRELRLAGAERQVLDVIERLPLGLDRGLAGRAIELAPAEADRGLIALASCTALPKLELTAPERLVLESDIRALGRELAGAEPARIHALLSGSPPELIALAGASSAAAAAAVRSWFSELSSVRLSISGEDLLAAGIPQGADVGARLQATLAARLRGELAPGRESELAFALASPPQ